MEYAQEMQEIKCWEPQMSSREAIYRLEPSNLLEPLDLGEQPAESIRRLAYPDYGTSKPAANSGNAARARPAADRARETAGNEQMKHGPG
jgi:hypothetical protein